MNIWKNPLKISEGTLAEIPERISVCISCVILREIPGAILEKSIGTTTGGSSKNIPGEIPGGMSGEIPTAISGAIYDGITEGSYGKNPGGIRRCILAKVSVKNSEVIVGRIPVAFLGTNPEIITIGTLQDDHRKNHEGEILGELP